MYDWASTALRVRRKAEAQIGRASHNFVHESRHSKLTGLDAKSEPAPRLAQ